MKHLGDITKLDGHKLPLVDIVTGGSPCQDLSVAGKRAGLAGARSGLFMEQIRIIKEMRDESAKQLRLRGADDNIRDIKPRYMVWENVPGAFSSNKGEDFRCVLEETARIVCKDAVIPKPENGKWSPSGVILGDGWSIAWRVHDAQFWGVPQRRKRIALVADFGGDTAPKILFESEGLSGDSEQSEQKGQETTGNTRESPNQTSYTLKIRGGVEVDSKGKKAGKGALVQTELSGTLGVSQDQTLIQTISECAGFKGGQSSGGIGYQEECSPTLQADPSALEPTVYCLQGNGIDRADTAGCNGKGWRENQSYTLNTIDRPAVCTYQQTTEALCASGYDKLGIQEAANDMYVVQSNWDGSQISPTLTSNNAGGGQRMPDKDNFNAVITYGLDRASFNQGQNAQYDFSVEEEIAQTLVSRGPGGVLARQSAPYVRETTKE